MPFIHRMVAYFQNIQCVFSLLLFTRLFQVNGSNSYTYVVYNIHLNVFMHECKIPITYHYIHIYNVYYLQFYIYTKANSNGSWTVQSTYWLEQKWYFVYLYVYNKFCSMHSCVWTLLVYITIVIYILLRKRLSLVRRRSHKMNWNWK